MSSNIKKKSTYTLYILRWSSAETLVRLSVLFSKVAMPEQCLRLKNPSCSVFAVTSTEWGTHTVNVFGCFAHWMVFICHYSSLPVFLAAVTAATITVAAAAAVIIGSSVPAVFLHELLCFPVLPLHQAILWYNVSNGQRPTQWLQRPGPHVWRLYSSLVLHPLEKDQRILQEHKTHTPY